MTTRKRLNDKSKKSKVEVTNETFDEIIALAKDALEYGRKDDECLWKIGDVLVDVCPIGAVGVNNGSSAKMRKIAEKMEQEGLDARFSLAYLKKIRATAHAFPQVKRLTTVTWALHDLAAKPETLDKMLEEAKSAEKRLTTTFAKSLIAKQTAADNAEEQKAKAKAIKNDADAAVRDCVDKANSAQTSASALRTLANEATKRVSSHLKKLGRRVDLIESIKKARDQAADAVKAWDELLQKVSAVTHATH